MTAIRGLFLLATLFVSLLCLPRANGFDSFPQSDANRTFDTSFVIHAPPTAYQNANLTASQRQVVQRTPFYLYNYITANYDPAKVRRAVITLHGLGRDAWLYFDQTNEALRNATSHRDRQSNRTRLERDEVVIMAPLFMNEEDRGGFPVDQQGMPTTTALVWSRGSWAEGADSIYPNALHDDGGGATFAPPGLSSFEAMDEVVRFFADTRRFPLLNTIIVAGHSLGAQMAQRYALIGSVPSGSVAVHFVVANPGSFAYLTEWRPNDTAGCAASFNTWKFGLGTYQQRYLSDFIRQGLDTTTDVESVVARYRRRIVSYLFGLADTEPGDVRCEAMTQGAHHLARGQNYMRHLTEMPGGFPQTHTVDYIPNVGHWGLEMFSSRAGLERLFFINLNGTEVATAVGDEDTGFTRWLAQQTNAAAAGRTPSWTVWAAVALVLSVSELCTGTGWRSW